MKGFILNENDLKEIMARGITEEQVMSQIKMFRKKPSHMSLNRPCTVGDGIRIIREDEVHTLTLLHQNATGKGRLMKFIPASGAASRMFKSLIHLRETDPAVLRDNYSQTAIEGDRQAKEVLSFMNGIRRFAFFDELKSVMMVSGFDIDAEITQGKYKNIIEYLLGSQGLGYSDKPKGLIKFHRYHEGGRTAFEEHLVEAAHYIRDERGICRLHFTVSSEHQEKFEELLDEIAPQYEGRHNVEFHVDFSLQKSSTDTIAVDMNNRPFREKDGDLLFRPGGHGALIENLNDLKGDIIYIKNIDNVAPDRLKDHTSAWKKTLAGCLIEIQLLVFEYLKRLAQGNPDKGLMKNAMDFAVDSLCISPPSDWHSRSLHDRIGFLSNALNCPMRVCGMVKNQGEPGGGPFWVKGKDDTVSRQIIESAQVDPGSKDQQTILASATHFNPVDIVCGVRDYKGNPFDLRRYVDKEAVFISRKSKDGRDLKALELPGLWNGGMSHWITIFVEVPIITFNPVKTVNDLIREEHQSV